MPNKFARTLVAILISIAPTTIVWAPSWADGVEEIICEDGSEAISASFDKEFMLPDECTAQAPGTQAPPKFGLYIACGVEKNQPKIYSSFPNVASK